MQPLKSEPESPHKIRGGCMGIFKANLKGLWLPVFWLQKKVEGPRGGSCDGNGMCHTSRAAEDIAVNVHAYKCSLKASGRSFPWPWKPFYDVSVRLLVRFHPLTTPSEKPRNYATTFSVV